MQLSVIIPVYGVAVKECLESFLVLGGLMDEVELIVVDDGSDPPVAPSAGAKLVRIPHGGAAAARNAGLEHASGRFVWFFDADDRLMPGTLSVLLDVLQRLPDDADLFHTGAMTDISSPGMQPPKVEADASATRWVTAAELFVPKSAYLDHTTYIISRRLLCGNSGLRYPGLSILEDSLFVLQLLEAAKCIYVNETLRPYLRLSYVRSTTAGAWDVERCNRFVPDICYFFDYYGAYLMRHSDIASGAACYRRLRYVYMRVLAVKGCPWPLMRAFRSASFGGFPLSGIRERLLFSPPFCRTLSFLCRLFRKK